MEAFGPSFFSNFGNCKVRFGSHIINFNSQKVELSMQKSIITKYFKVGTKVGMQINHSVQWFKIKY